jgi:hypothetical protein
VEKRQKCLHIRTPQLEMFWRFKATYVTGQLRNLQCVVNSGSTHSINGGTVWICAELHTNQTFIKNYQFPNCVPRGPDTREKFPMDGWTDGCMHAYVRVCLYIRTRAVWKVRGLVAVAAIMQREAVTVMQSCSGGSNVVVARSSALWPSLGFELQSF